MPLNINFESVIRAAKEGGVDSCKSLLAACDAKLATLKIEADSGKEVTGLSRYGRGPQKGQPKGSEQYNWRSFTDWVNSVDGKDQAELDKLLALQATLSARIKGHQ